AGNHADHFDGWHGVNYQLSEPRFEFGRRTEARSFAECSFHRGEDARVALAEDERSPRADVIEIAVAIDVEKVRPSAAPDKRRLAAHAAECTGRAVDAAGNELRCPLKSLFTASASLFHAVIIRAEVRGGIRKNSGRFIGGSPRNSFEFRYEVQAVRP